MKLFTNHINENCTTSDVNQGNAYSKTGVSNHLTPVGNIVTNVRNFFGSHLGVVASIAEDGVSVKLNSSYFTSPAEIKKVLYNYEIMRGTCLAQYIMQQGLDLVKTVNVGQFYVVYFCPKDIKTAQPGAEAQPANLPCKEQYQDEAEMISIIKEDEEEELEDLTKKKLEEIIKSKDKVKAAKQLELLVTQEIELPRDYYFAGVKDNDGEESIALRWKYTKKRAHNKTSQSTRSLINIYDISKDGVWVGDFDKDGYFQLPKEVETLIKNILDFLGAEETNNPCIYSLDGLDESNRKEDKKEEKDEDTDKDKDTDTNSDDKSDDKSDEKDNKDDKSNDKKDDSSDDLL